MQDASSKQQQKPKIRTSQQQTGLPPQSALPIRGKTNKQTNKQKLSTIVTKFSEDFKNGPRETKTLKYIYIILGKIY